MDINEFNALSDEQKAQYFDFPLDHRLLVPGEV